MLNFICLGTIKKKLSWNCRDIGTWNLEQLKSLFQVHGHPFGFRTNPLTPFEVRAVFLRWPCICTHSLVMICKPLDNRPSCSSSVFLMDNPCRWQVCALNYLGTDINKPCSASWEFFWFHAHPICHYSWLLPCESKRQTGNSPRHWIPTSGKLSATHLLLGFSFSSELWISHKDNQETQTAQAPLHLPSVHPSWPSASWDLS